VSSVPDWITAISGGVAAAGTLVAVVFSIQTARRAEKARREAEQRSLIAERNSQLAELERERATLEVERLVANNHLAGMGLVGGQPGLAAEYAARSAHASERIAKIDQILGDSSLQD
jgi:hypothetical protein